MSYTENEKEQLNKELIKYCEKIGFGKFTVEVLNGTPINIERGLQRIRLDKGLTNFPGNATMK